MLARLARSLKRRPAARYSFLSKFARSYWPLSHPHTVTFHKGGRRSLREVSLSWNIRLGDYSRASQPFLIARLT